MTRHIVVSFLLGLCALVLTSCASTQQLFQQTLSSDQQSTENASNPVNLQGFPNDPVFWQANTLTTWDKLQHIALPELKSAEASATDPNIRGWLKLAIISKQYSTDTTQLVNQLIAWRNENPNHTANSLFPGNGELNSILNDSPPRHVVLLLPLQGNLSASGQAVRDGYLSAYYKSGFKNSQTISFTDTNSNPNIAALYQQALSQGADTVVGPLTKEQVQQLLSQGSIGVPTIALNYTDGWGSLPANLYEFGLSPVHESKQLAEKAWQAGHKRALIIAPQNEWGQRVVKNATASWNALGGSVADTFYFTPQTDMSKGIAGLLHANTANNKDNNKIAPEQQRRQDFDVIFLLAASQNARQILPLIKYYYAANIPVFSTSAVYSGFPSPQKDSDLNGVTFCDTPWTLQMAGTGGSETDVRFNRLYAVGRDAYLLGNQIGRLNRLPNFPIYGSTGALSLTSDHKIYRRLAWVQMRDGHA